MPRAHPPVSRRVTLICGASVQPSVSVAACCLISAAMNALKSAVAPMSLLVSAAEEIVIPFSSIAS